MLKPTFDTDFTVEIPTTKVTRNGKFEDSLLFQFYLSKKDLYVLNPYMVNLDGDHDLVKITNHKATSDRKILIVKDSFADVMIPFMANEFSEIIVIDLRKLSDQNLADIIASEKPDMVIVAYYAALMDSEVTTNFMGE